MLTQLGAPKSDKGISDAPAIRIAHSYRHLFVIVDGAAAGVRIGCPPWDYAMSIDEANPVGR